MHVQSLTSIVNNPKKDSVFKRMKTLVKHQIQGGPSPYFRTLKESNVEDSDSIPKVRPNKDFKDYFKKL